MSGNNFNSGGRCFVLESEDSEKSVTDLVANLAKSVAQLQRRIDLLEEQSELNVRNIESFAETATTASNVADDCVDKIEMLIDDIVTLDERTGGSVLCRRS